jgi:hypothetical protein
MLLRLAQPFNPDFLCHCLSNPFAQFGSDQS